MISDARSSGAKPKYNGFVDCVRKIHRNEGMAAFYKGWSPNVQRAMLVNLGELATYDVSKRSLIQYTPLQDNIVCHAAASVISGFFSTLCSCPADVVKTRLMQNPDAVQSTLKCAAGIIKNEGFLALYKG